MMRIKFRELRRPLARHGQDDLDLLAAKLCAAASTAFIATGDVSKSSVSMMEGFVTGKEGIEGVNSAVSGYDTPSDHFAVIKYGIFPSPQSYKNTSTDISRLPKKKMRAKRLTLRRPDKGDGNLRVEKISSEASKSVISYDTNQQCNALAKVFWACSTCTFHNYNMEARECEICHSGRDSNV